MSLKYKYFGWTKLDIKELIPTNFRAIRSVFSSLRTRNFLLYFVGQCISLSGSWIQYVAMSWLVYRITGSIMLLATVALLNQLPNLVFTPLAGVLSDRFDKFKIIIIAQILFMLQALLLAYLTLSDNIEVWHLLGLSLFTGIVASIEAPSRQSFYSKLVPAKDMTNAIALNSTTINGSRFIGPTIGGVLIAMLGEGYCFLINAISYIAVIAALFMMSLTPHKPKTTQMSILSEMKEGITYVVGFLPLRAVLLFVAVVSFFALPFMSVIPALVKDVLGGDSTLLGYVNSSIGAGALVASLILAARKRVKGLGKMVTLSGIVMGVALMIMAFTNSGVVACLLAFPLGLSMIGSMAASNTLLQTIVDDDKRGRVMSFFTMAFVGMSPVGGMIYGWVAEQTSLSVSIFISGIVCLITSAVYEYYRPAVRAAAHDRFANKGVVREIASGINVANNNPF